MKAAKDDVARVRAWLRQGVLLGPSAARVPGFVDLVHAVMHVAGLPRLRPGAAARSIASRLQGAEHLLVVLVDGLGMDCLERLPARSFLRRNLVGEVRAVFPSTTAAALTTLATAHWPAQHAVLSWWLFLARRDVSVTTLPFVERGTERPLSQLGVPASELYPVASVWPGLRMRAVSVLPAEIAGSVFSRYCAGATPRIGFGRLAEAEATAADIVGAAEEPSLVYLYLPHLDSLMHEHGTSSAPARELAGVIDELLRRLARRVHGRARMIVCADHGQVDVPPQRRFVLPRTHVLRSFLRAQPSGEARTPFFHVTPGRERAFADFFRRSFGGLYALLSAEDASRLGLFGPGRLLPAARERLGTFIAVSREPAKLYVEPCGVSVKHPGAHGGLLPAEMRVPLVIV